MTCEDCLHIDVCYKRESVSDNYAEKCGDCLTATDLQKPQGGWIPVSERLPEKTGYYLVTRKGFSIKNHVKRVGYDASTKRWSEGSIIAWQPLPEPYKEGGAE